MSSMEEGSRDSNGNCSDSTSLGGSALLQACRLWWAATLVNVVVSVAVVPVLLLAMHVLVFGSLLHSLMGLISALTNRLGIGCQGSQDGDECQPHHLNCTIGVRGGAGFDAQTIL